MKNIEDVLSKINECKCKREVSAVVGDLQEILNSEYGGWLVTDDDADVWNRIVDAVEEKSKAIEESGIDSIH